MLPNVLRLTIYCKFRNTSYIIHTSSYSCELVSDSCVSFSCPTSATDVLFHFLPIFESLKQIKEATVSTNKIILLGSGTPQVHPPQLPSEPSKEPANCAPRRAASVAAPGPTEKSATKCDPWRSKPQKEQRILHGLMIFWMEQSKLPKNSQVVVLLVAVRSTSQIHLATAGLATSQPLRSSRESSI